MFMRPTLRRLLRTNVAPCVASVCVLTVNAEINLKPQAKAAAPPHTAKTGNNSVSQRVSRDVAARPRPPRTRARVAESIPRADSSDDDKTRVEELLSVHPTSAVSPSPPRSARTGRAAPTTENDAAQPVRSFLASLCLHMDNHAGAFWDAGVRSAEHLDALRDFSEPDLHLLLTNRVGLTSLEVMVVYLGLQKRAQSHR